MRFKISRVFLFIHAILFACCCNTASEKKDSHTSGFVQASEEQKTLVIRTSFGNDKAWEQLCEDILRPQTESHYTPYVEFISDKKYNSKTPEEVTRMLPAGYDQTFVFVVDDGTLKHHESPVICIDLGDEKGRMFRVIPSVIWGVENNLRIANLHFYELAHLADSAGIFRGIK